MSISTRTLVAFATVVAVVALLTTSDQGVDETPRWRSLLDDSISDCTLFTLIRSLARATKSSANARRFANALTPADAMTVYDRLMRSLGLSTDEVIKLLNMLIFRVNRALFTAAAAHHNVLNSLITTLPIQQKPADDIPAAVVEFVASLTSDWDDHVPDVVHAVRQRYPPPFHKIFPNNDQVAAQLLAQDDLLDALSQPGVVLGLARAGIRFDLGQYVNRTEPSAALLFALLPLFKMGGAPSDLLTIVTKRNRYDLAAPLFAHAAFAARIVEDAPAVVQVLQTTIRGGRLGLLEDVVGQPFADAIVNIGDRHDQVSLLSCAIRELDLVAAEILLRVPNLDLRTPDRWGFGPLQSLLSYPDKRRAFIDLIERDRPDLLEETLDILGVDEDPIDHEEMASLSSPSPSYQLIRSHISDDNIIERLRLRVMVRFYGVVARSLARCCGGD